MNASQQTSPAPDLFQRSENRVLTPKQVAAAIAVSESSVKRWCDKGVINAHYTGGGHRRIPLGELLQFLRASRRRLVAPEQIGLPPVSGRGLVGLEQAAAPMAEGLLRGDLETCRQIVLELYLAEHDLGAISDLVLAPCFQAIGAQWECGDAQVYQERRACELVLRVVHELRSLLPPPPATAPVAIGGAVEGDPYNLATTLVELVLHARGWKATSLGDDLPFETLSAAVAECRPKLFWLSCSHVRDEERFVERFNELQQRFADRAAFVVGGRALNDETLRRRLTYAAYCDTLQQLETFADSVRGA